MTTSDPTAPRLIDRLLNVFTEVRPGEGVTALLMTLNIFFLLASYYILKPAREAFMSLEGTRGAELASYTAAAMALLLLPIVYGYGKLAQRLVRRTLIGVVTGVFILNLLFFYVMAASNFPHIGVIFFIWVGIFNIMVVAQFWAYGNDIYLPEEGKRLFPLIMIGQNAGAVLGPQIAKYSVGWSGTTHFMLLIAAGLLAICIGLTLWIDRRVRTRTSGALPGEAQERQEIADEPLSAEGGFQLIWKHRYLLLIAVLIMTLNLVNTTGEFILRDAAFEAGQEAAAAASPQTAAEAEKIKSNFVASYYGNFFSWVNLFTFLIQALLASRIIKFLGVRGALFVLPSIALIGYGAIALLPLLMVITVAKVGENSTDYSLMNTLRAALYLPTTREMKYKAKQAIDTFFVRVGDVISAGVVALGSEVLNLGARGFSVIVFFIVLFWLALCRAIVKEHRKISPEEN